MENLEGKTFIGSLIKTFDRFINPIWLLETRTNLRHTRFFITFLIALILSIITIIIALLALTSNTYLVPDQIGKGLFIVFFVLESCIIVLFFPAFSCTAIIGEKERKTFDLLINSNLKPSEIILGKFLGAFSHSFLFIIASFPLIMVAFLFGGVPLALILVCYFVLLVIASLFIIISLWASCFYRSTVKAIISSYAIVFTLCFPYIAAMTVLIDEYLYRSNLLRFFAKGFTYNHFLLIATPIIGIGLLIVLPYLWSLNLLKPASANKSTSLRIYFFILLAIMCWIGCSFFVYNIYIHNFARARKIGDELYAYNIMAHSFLGGIIVLLGTLTFPLEDPVPVFNFLKKIKKSTFKYILWLFSPGALSGAVFTCVTSAFFLAIIFTSIAFLTSFFDTSMYRTYRVFSNTNAFFTSPMVIWTYIFFISMFHAYLSMKVKRKTVKKAIAISVNVFLLVILPLYMPMFMAIEGRFQSYLWDFTYLSPVLTYWSSVIDTFYWAERESINFNLFQTLPIHYVGISVYLIAGAILLKKNIVLNQIAFKKAKEREDALAALQNDQIEKREEKTSMT